MHAILVFFHLLRHVSNPKCVYTKILYDISQLVLNARDILGVSYGVLLGVVGAHDHSGLASACGGACVDIRCCACSVSGSSIARKQRESVCLCFLCMFKLARVTMLWFAALSTTVAAMTLFLSIY